MQSLQGRPGVLDTPSMHARTHARNGWMASTPTDSTTGCPSGQSHYQLGEYQQFIINRYASEGQGQGQGQPREGLEKKQRPIQTNTEMFDE